MRKLTSVLALALLCSCATSNMSRNTTQEGDFLLNGGKNGQQSWNDGLIFKHLSWYKELSLVFDVHLARLDKNSPFLSWLSPKEKENYDSCHDFIVTVAYAIDGKRISMPMFMDVMKKQGFSRISLSQFHSFLKLHPDFELSSLQNYEVFGLCGTQEPKSDGISIEFPSFAPLYFK